MPATLPHSIVIYDNHLGRVLRAMNIVAAGDTRYDAIPIKYELTLSKESHDLLTRNPLMKQAIQVEMFALVKEIVTGIPLLAPGYNPTQMFARSVNTVLDTGKVRVNRLVQDKFDRHAQVDAAWSKYYKAQRKELAFAAIGVVTFAVSAGLAVPTMGASLAVAIVSGVRALMTGITKLAECARTAETYEVRVREEIARLKKAYDTRTGGSVARGRAMQIGGAAVNASGILQPIEWFRSDILPNVGKIRGDLMIYKGKLGNLYATANIMTAQLFDLLDKTEQLRAQYAAANPGFDPTQAKWYSKLGRLESGIDRLLQSGSVQVFNGFSHSLTISDAYMRYENGWPKATAMEQTIQTDLMTMDPSPVAVARLGKAVGVLTNLAFSLANYQEAMQITSKLASDASLTAATAYQDGFGLLKDGMRTGIQVAGTATAWAGDLIGTGKDVKELAEELGLSSSSDPAVASYTAQLEAAYQTVSIPPAPPPRRPSGARLARPTGVTIPPPPPLPAASGVAAASPPAPRRPPPPPPPRPVATTT